MGIHDVGRKFRAADATVTVLSGDSSPLPVAGAEVFASWGGLASANVQGTTPGDGTVVLNSPKVNDNSSGEFHLTIFDGTAAGHDYVVGEVEGCIVAVPKNGTATALFYEDGGLANGTYHYVVRAVLNGVESVDSIQANVNVDGVSAPVPALGGVTVTLSPKGKNWPGEAVVEVVDQANGQPLAGAVVTGYWTLPPTVRAVSKPRRSA